MSDQAIIETSELTKRFGERVAVDRVTRASAGLALTAFLGHNGAGRRRRSGCCSASPALTPAP